MNTSQRQCQQSQDQFEDLKEQIETFHCHTDQYPTKHTNNQRLPQLTEKHKLGFIPPVFKKQSIIHHHKKENLTIGKILKVGSAIFRSNFQSGSLGTVELIGINNFKISLDQQSNSSRGNIWFYFAVEGVKGEAHFTITGFKKTSSLYNQGMKICYRESTQNKWKRGGSQISYQQSCSDGNQRDFQTKFTLNFKPNQHIITQIAYCFPYGLSKLNFLLSEIRPKAKIQTMANSFEGRNLSLINIGNLSSKQVIVISARVHPGQTVSSLMMEGFLKQLVSQNDFSNYLKKRFLFKIMPMINMDGVSHGNFRFSASGFDLNRRWKQPNEEHHPEIYYLKQMILHQNKSKHIRMFIDLHGHSRKKNVFFYGCCQESENILDNFKSKSFPFLMSKLHQAFSFKDCNFDIKPDKQGTARITLWNQLKISQIFTLEASFCSSQKGQNYLQSDYEKMGEKLCKGISLYFFDQKDKQFPQLGKMVHMRQTTYNLLKTDQHLLRLGNQENSGSDSEPEKGQKSEKIDKVKPLETTPFSETFGKLTYKQPNSNHLVKIYHKLQEKQMRNDLNGGQVIKQDQNLKFISQPLQKRLSTFQITLEDQQLQTTDEKPTKYKNNIRVHSISKSHNLPEIKQTLCNEEQLTHQNGKNAINAKIISQFQTEQYRKVKHAEQMRMMAYSEKPQFRKVITGQNIETRRFPTPISTPRIAINTSEKKRKNSLQVFYNKSKDKKISKNERYEANKHMFNIKGSSIFKNDARVTQSHLSNLYY